jgi:uncharacterized protein
MRKSVVLAAAVAVWSAFLLSAGRATPAAPRGIAGKWLGTMAVPGASLRMAFEISQTADGGYTAVVHSIDQGAGNIPMTSAILKGDSLSLELANTFAYEGTLLPDGDTITGNWVQGESIPLTLRRVDAFPELDRPQNPKKPYPYREEEVAYDNPAAGIRIAGTLTLPKGEGPFPAVLLIAGSGPSDRDEFVLGHKPFLVLADHLTRQGVAVLRVDKRGIGKTTGTYRGSGIEEFASDVVAGVAYLRGRREVDAKHVGLVGHSEGGQVALTVAARTRDVAFVVLLASPGISLYDILVLQDGTEAKAAGKSDAEVALIRGFSRRFYGLILRSKDAAEIERETKALYAVLTEEEKQALKVFGWPDLQGSLGLPWALAPGAREALQFDVGPALRKVQCPVLALNGAKDCQVPPKENLGAIESGLRAGGNTDYTVRELPDLNHLLQTCSTGATSEYSKIEETMSPLALQAVSDWVASRTRAAQAGPQ